MRIGIFATSASNGAGCKLFKFVYLFFFSSLDNPQAFILA